MSKARIIVNGEYLNENAATYREMAEWLRSIHDCQLDCPVMMGVPGGKVYAIRKPVDKSEFGFIGEAIEVETRESDE